MERVEVGNRVSDLDGVRRAVRARVYLVLARLVDNWFLSADETPAGLQFSFNLGESSQLQSIKTLHILHLANEHEENRGFDFV